MTCQPPKCVDCCHYKAAHRVPSPFGVIEIPAFCRAADPVGDGKRPVECWTARRDPNLCGMDGKYWTGGQPCPVNG